MQKITKGEALNWPQFYRFLTRKKVPREMINAAFNVERYSETAYLVTVNDPTEYDAVCRYIKPRVDSSRATASLMGNSHTGEISGAVLITRNIDFSGLSAHELSLENVLPNPSKLNAIIIENLECFMDYQNVYHFLVNYCGLNIPINELEFIYGAGNSISNKHSIAYLKSFRGKVFSLLDIDVGGFRIFKNIRDNGISELKFLYPHDIFQRLKVSLRPLTDDDVRSLDGLLEINTEICNLIKMMLFTKTKIEQESYRA